MQQAKNNEFKGSSQSDTTETHSAIYKKKNKKLVAASFVNLLTISLLKGYFLADFTVISYEQRYLSIYVHCGL